MEGCEMMIQRRSSRQHHIECEFRMIECNFCGISQRHKDEKVKVLFTHLFRSVAIPNRIT